MSCVSRADAVSTALAELGVALDHNRDAQNRYDETVDRGADLYNAGDIAGAEALYRGEAAAGLAELRQRNQELQTALTAYHDAYDDLEEALR